MIGLGKCDSCSNKAICKFVEKMKEYEEGVEKNVIGEHNHVVGFFPINVKVDCESYRVSSISNSTTSSTSGNGSSGLGVIRCGSANTECDLGYIRHELTGLYYPAEPK